MSDDKGISSAIRSKLEDREEVSCMTPAGASDYYYNKGYFFYEQDKFDQAIAAFQKAIELDPDYTAAHYYLGVSLDELGDYGNAVDAYQRAFQLADDVNEYAPVGCFYLMFERGNRLAGEARYDKAAVAFQIAVQLKPDFADAYNNLGLALDMQGKQDEAIAAYQKAIELEPDDPDPRNNLAGSLVEDCQRKLTPFLSEN